MKKILYHGSRYSIKEPIYGFTSGMEQDFGPGFYCTEDEALGKEWASRERYSGINNKYELEIDGLKILDLTNEEYSVLNWLAILFHFKKSSSESKLSLGYKYLERFYIDISSYDVVIGYRADDRYFAFPKAFLNNEITLKSVEEVFLKGELGKQVLIRSRKAFSQLKYISMEESDPIDHDNYFAKIDRSNRLFNKLKKEDLYVIEGKISYLMKKDGFNV